MTECRIKSFIFQQYRGKPASPFVDSNFQQVLFQHLSSIGSNRDNLQIRLLNSHFKKFADKNITKIQLYSLVEIPKIHRRNFSSNIQMISVNVNIEKEELSLIKFLTQKYFPELKAVEITIAGQPKSIDKCETIILTESLFFDNLNIIYINNNHTRCLEALQFQGCYDVVIQNSFFDGLGLKFSYKQKSRMQKEYPSLQISNTHICSQNKSQLEVFSFEAVSLRDVFASNCTGLGIYLKDCSNILLDNVEISDSTIGLYFEKCSILSILNISVHDCYTIGITFDNSTCDSVKNCLVQDCDFDSICSENSNIVYDEGVFPQNQNLQPPVLIE
eukprot:TRINITY_DN7442_c0_g4_i1.p1 TRINITY_DN7442_c0_g4~~TRINITY_DN7442_c0_g4_i1.p1  ORF type:complete len:331 (-),score=6.06 TRINITY_DN7442_c0_g4_i1:458-1450(-)